MQKLIQLKNKKGFTLIEMLVVILIIVILIAIAVPAVAGYRNDAQETADSGAAETAFNALEASSTKFNPADAENQGTGGLLGISANGEDVYSAGLYIEKSELEASTSGNYLNAVHEFLGSNFEGTIKFRINAATGSILWVTYIREGAEKNSANTMLYHAVDGVTGYLDEVDAKYNQAPYLQHS